MRDPLPDLRRRLSADGLDLVHAFPLSAVAGDPAPNLPDLGHADPLGILVGNSRALWSALAQALRDGAVDGDADHPLDRWVAARITEAARASGHRHAVRFSWEAPPRRVPMQHIAHRAGLAHLSPSHLCVHPRHGPWIGLRAVIVLDHPGPTAPTPAPDPCTPCARPCLEALARASAGAAPTEHGVRGDWTRWAAVRQVCPVGVEQAYGPEQLAYHYTHDKRWLP